MGVARVAAAGSSLDEGEQEQLIAVLEERFANPLDDAAAAVRAAERDLEEARERLVRAEEAAASQPYRSDPLVFMREGLSEELDGLGRKTNPKKVRVAYRFLLDRAVELATAEVQSFHDDLAAAEDERANGVAACREGVRRAGEVLEAARTMAASVESAQQAARDGLAVTLEKLSEATAD